MSDLNRPGHEDGVQGDEPVHDDDGRPEDGGDTAAPTTPPPPD
jgi:hypothetical protein